MKKRKITYTRHHKGVRTKTYRNRTIVTDYSYGENEEWWLKEGKGTSQVFDAENNPVTSVLECFFCNYVSSEYDVMNYYSGWILLGDFIFYQDASKTSVFVADGTFSLWTPEGNKVLCSSRSPKDIPVNGLLFWDYTVPGLSEEEQEKAYQERSCGNFEPYDAVAGAARVFVKDYGWRWLFPHPDGAAAALQRLQETTSYDDLKHMIENGYIHDATEIEWKLMEQHFAVVSHAAPVSDTWKYDRGLDLSKVDMASPENPKLYELWQQTFPTDPLNAMDLKIERLRVPIEKNGWVAADKISLQEVLDGADHGPFGWKISIQNKSTSSLAPLSRIPNIVALDITGLSRLENITKEDIKGLEQLEYLNCSNAIHLQEISLEDLPNLRHVSFYGCLAWKNLEQVSKLHQLQSIDLAQCSQITSLSPLSNLEHLEEVTFYGLSLTSLKGLPKSYLSTVKDLIVGFDQLSDLSALRDAISLESLEIRSNALQESELKVLASLPKLKKLSVTSPHITTLNEFHSVTNIEDLEVTSVSDLEDISSLKNFPHLTKLRLKVHNESDLTPLSLLSKVEHLTIACRRRYSLSSLDWIKTYTNLKELRFEDGLNNVHDISPLASLTALEKLYIYSHSQISDISPLAQLINLKYLQFSAISSRGSLFVPISDLQPIASLQKLEDISFPHMDKITSLEPLAQLTQLTHLSFGDLPKLTSLVPLLALKNLKILRLDSEKIPQNLPGEKDLQENLGERWRKR